MALLELTDRRTTVTFSFSSPFGWRRRLTGLKIFSFRFYRLYCGTLSQSINFILIWIRSGWTQFWRRSLLVFGVDALEADSACFRVVFSYLATLFRISRKKKYIVLPFHPILAWSCHLVINRSLVSISSLLLWRNMFYHSGKSTRTKKNIRHDVHKPANLSSGFLCFLQS